MASGLEGATYVGEQKCEEGEAAAAFFAGDTLEELQESGWGALELMLGVGLCEGVCEALQVPGIDGGEEPGGLEEIADSGLAFGVFGKLGELSGDGVSGADHAVDGVEDAFVVCGLECVVEGEEGFGVLARCGVEAALQV